MAREAKTIRSYPKPGDLGGRLVREAIGFLRASGLKLPFTSHIHIAVSGGLDSTAMALLLVCYGRRIADSKKITLLHINHRWRGEASDADALWVKNLARQLGVRYRGFKLKPPTQLPKGTSWEEAARSARQSIYRKLPGPVFTAHHADDLAETVLWRLLTGSADTHGGGIAIRTPHEVRPLLRVRKAALRKFLDEESQGWREDSTNADPRFMRARMRAELMPTIEKIFPRAVERLVEQALGAQSNRARTRPAEFDPDLGQILSAAGLKLRRGNWRELGKAQRSRKPGAQVSLPGGWELRRQTAQKTASGAKRPPRPR